MDEEAVPGIGVQFEGLNFIYAQSLILFNKKLWLNNWTVRLNYLIFLFLCIVCIHPIDISIAAKLQYVIIVTETNIL